MIKRALWLGIGIAVGAIVVRKVTRAAHSYSPSGLAGRAHNSAAGLLDSVRDFVDDVREGMAEREAQIQAAFERGVSLDDLAGFDDLDDDLREGDLREDGLPDDDLPDGDLAGHDHRGGRTNVNGADVRP